MLIGKYNKSLIISYIGVIAAVLGMYFLARNGDLKLTMICYLIAGVCDMLDGMVARMMERDKDEELFGIQLDSLADTIDFVVFPIFVGLTLGYSEWFQVIGYVLLAMAGVQRLCHFNVLVINKKDKGPVKYYSGLPVTSTSITFPIIYLISKILFNINSDINIFETMFTLLTFASAILFVLNIKVPKPRGKAYPVMGALAVVGVILICVL
ncbi:MAG: CDP-alcohol phosphatidyltransferase family protein [Bacilli bacterium]|nr:CDP-alcohol phosphatidyltransferase family protein [Bacilli bacterium]